MLDSGVRTRGAPKTWHAGTCMCNACLLGFGLNLVLGKTGASNPGNLTLLLTTQFPLLSWPQDDPTRPLTGPHGADRGGSSAERCLHIRMMVAPAAVTACNI